MAGVKKELWLNELVKNFRNNTGFLERVPDYSQHVDNDVIHLVRVGADPIVLIDNAVYPIAVNSRTDTDLTVTLRKLDTTNTPVTRDELYALGYDKIQSVVEQHTEVLKEKALELAAFSLAPTANATNTPVIQTTGVADPVVNNYKKMKIADVISMKRAFDMMKVPQNQRIMVIDPRHLANLLEEDLPLQNRVAAQSPTETFFLYGFEVFQNPMNPTYDVGYAKNVFQAAPLPTDRPSTLFFYGPRTFKAMSGFDMFWSLAENDPTMRRDVVGFRNRFVCLPKVQEAVAALVSAT